MLLLTDLSEASGIVTPTMKLKRGAFTERTRHIVETCMRTQGAKHEQPDKRRPLSYVVAAVIFAAVDVVWIGTVANNQYESQIGDCWPPASTSRAPSAFYLMYVVGIVHYGIRPNDSGGHDAAAGDGAALFGFFTYATWALTALAVLKDFPAVVALTDIAWGVAVCSAVTWLTATILRRMFARAGTLK